ncbi:MAG: hypothetical protein P8J33_03805 [Pirellulaceae bacterium]|nr:hypothetical protein [Pirellulaceae bacterium]
MIKKLLIIPVLVVIACFFAGVYGAVHNQISYTVAPEYFTKFKFHQFGLIHFQDRVGAAIVGWNAAWWMGVIIGAVLIPLGLLIRGNANYFWGMIRVFGTVALTTLIVGLVALAIAFVVVDPDNIGEFTRYNNEIDDNAAFARAGTMHNFSYLGGLIGIITGAIAVFWQRKRYADGEAQIETQPSST